MSGITKIQVVTNYITPRIEYIMSLCFGHWLNIECNIVTPDNYRSHEPTIVYGISNFSSINSITIPAEGLLFQHNIQKKYNQPSISVKDNYWRLFPIKGNNDIDFDVFSAIFWCVSRYEEFLDFTEDEHGRFEARESYLFKQNVLQLPVVNIWLNQLRELCNNRWNMALEIPKFQLLPTYDIDIAFQYSQKGKLIDRLSKIKSFFFNRKQYQQRKAVKEGKQLDPFDSFQKICRLHKSLNIPAISFILCAKKRSDFDRNNIRNSTQFIERISMLMEIGDVAIHPSYRSHKNQNILLEEKNYLGNITTEKITQSRQHYIKFKLPDTYLDLISVGITDEYSMGYTTYNGFRAGTNLSFPFFNLKENKTEKLMIHPFVFMDATAHFKLGYSKNETRRELESLVSKIKEYGGPAILIFHNYSLGSDPQWDGYWEMYEQFLTTTF